MDVAQKIAKKLLDEVDPQACTQMEYESEIEHLRLNVIRYGEDRVRRMLERQMREQNS